MESTKNGFRLGQTVIMPNALETLHPIDVQDALARHARCDWGDCESEDAEQNDFALGQHLRIRSAYHDRNGAKFWVITEADRSLTTVRLPEDHS